MRSKGCFVPLRIYFNPSSIVGDDGSAGGGASRRATQHKRALGSVLVDVKPSWRVCNISCIQPSSVKNTSSCATCSHNRSQNRQLTFLKWLREELYVQCLCFCQSSNDETRVLCTSRTIRTYSVRWHDLVTLQGFGAFC